MGDNEVQRPQIGDKRRRKEYGTIDGSLRTCMGMIDVGTLEVAAQSHVNYKNRELARTAVTLSPVGEAILVRLKSSSEYLGFLEAKIGKLISQILKNSSAELAAFISFEPISNSTNLTAKHIYAIIYAPHEEVELIGIALSRDEIFLQHPTSIDDGVQYENPHFLIRPGRAIEVPIRSEQDIMARQSVLSRREVEKLFKSAEGPHVFSEIQASQIVKTTLTSHQKKALAMMTEKESGRLVGAEFHPLWESTTDAYGRRRYRNTVTGSMQQHIPEVCLGGILADEMGLGKSLSVLALIAGTLDGFKGRPVSSTSSFDTSVQRAKLPTTLLVAPKSTLQIWEEEIEKHTEPSSIKTCVYHGQSRTLKFADLGIYDLVITTYGTLCAEWLNSLKRSTAKQSLLHQFDWFRIVLDEAHVIRDHSTKQFKAACALTARHRWCVTGTPIQNRLEDLGALVRFLRVYPFDSISTFQTYIIKTIDKDNISGISKLRTLIKSIALRRTKDSVQDDLQPLPRINELCRVQLTSSERSLYDACRASALHIVDHSTGPEGKIRSFYNILQSILSLRQICSHGRELLSQRSLDRLQKFEKLGVMPETPDGATCELCADIFVLSESDISSQFAAVCLHIICAPCASIDQEGINEADRICPCCSNAALSIESIDTETTPKDSEMAGEEYRPSSKVQALLKSLRNSRITSSSDPIKSVIFSSWTSMLSLIELALYSEGLSFVRIDGQKTDSQRRAAILRFRTDPNCTILLASIGSAGVGLDLTAASHVHLMEPQWNPMAEEQALDRVHRMGQTKQVVAIRYVVEESIEEYVIALQKSKMQLFEQSFGNDATSTVEMARKRLETLRKFLD